MSSHRLVELLTSAGLNFGADEVLDVLWLAVHAPGLVVDAQKTVGDTKDPSSLPPREKADDANEAAAVSVQSGTKTGDADASNTLEAAGDRPLFAQVSGEGEKDGIAATPFIVPAGRALPGRLALMRSLRPFARPWAHRRLHEIDEERTAELSAELSGLVMPVFRPGRERWFGVDIVIEDDVAVEIWDATLVAFQRTLEQTGAFREVRLWRLALGFAPGEAILIGAPTQQVLAHRLVQDGGRRLIMFATHGASQNWANGRYAELIGAWQTHATLLLLHLLPRRRWGYGALGEPDGVAYSQAPGLAAADLHITHDWGRMEDGQASFATLPAIPLEPRALAEFAAMTMGGSQRVEAFSLDTAADWTGDELLETRKTGRVSQRLAQLRQASSEAYRLAIALSPTTFTLPVARLMQDAVLGAAAQPSQLGEIFLTGLVVPQDDEEGPIDQRSFAFVPDAAEQLASALSEDHAQKLSEEFGKRLAEHIAGANLLGAGFAALTPDPDGARSLPVWARPFARVARELARPITLPATPAPQQEAAVPEDDAVVVSLIEDIRATPQATLMAAFAMHHLNDRIPDTTASGIVRAINEAEWWSGLGSASRVNDAVETTVGDALRGKRILWVDDMPRNNAELVGILRSFGAEIDVRLSTEEARQGLEVAYDLILSDWSRPEGSDAGLQLVGTVRAAKQRAPVIIFAGEDNLDREVRTLASGGYAYTTHAIELFWLIGEALSQPARTRAIIGRLHKDLTAGGFDAGAADGIFDTATRHALNAFQREFGLPITAWPGAACHARITDFASRFHSQSRRQAEIPRPLKTRSIGDEMMERNLHQPPMSRDVNSLRVYRHGFGRCLLLKLVDDPVPNHVLINFGLASGVLQLRKRLGAVLDNIARETDGRIDHAIITRISGSTVSGFGDAGRLYVRQLILGWWEDERDRLGREIRARAKGSDRETAPEQLVRILRNRSQEVRFMSPRTEPLALDGGARFYMFGGQDEHLRIRGRARQPELDCAIELASGEVLLFIAADRGLWQQRLHQSWVVAERIVTCEDLLSRATFCSTHMLRREAIDFEGMLKQFLPSLRVLNIPIDREFSLERGWVPPEVRDINRLLEGRGGGIIFNELDEAAPKSGMIETGPIAYDVRFDSNSHDR